METPLTHLTIAQAASQIRQRRLSPLDLVEATLARIDYLNPQLNAYISVMGQHAKREARYAVEALARGESWGPLHGIPIAVKDLIDVAGERTTAASAFFRENVAVDDAEVIKRLQAAGAIIIGKTHLHEFAVGATNVNPHYGPARNPWNTSLSPGGSSGGSAAAVAAGMCAGALGTDTGGSVRLPSALTGLTGVRPAVGQVSTDRVVPMSWSLDTVGPMCHTAHDAAMLLDAINRQATSRHVEQLDRPLDGLRIGVPVDGFFWEDTEVDVITAVRGAVEAIAKQGVKVVDIHLPEIAEAHRAASIISLCDAAAYHAERLATEPERFGTDVRARLEWGAKHSAVDYAQARQTGREWRKRLGGLFESEIDVLVLPTTPVAAHEIAESEGVSAAAALLRFTYPFSLSKYPAMSLPCGLTRDGLPIGMQVVGPTTERLTNVGHLYQQLTDWHTRRPEL